VGFAGAGEHFGLGPAAQVSLEVRWPSGAVERIGDAVIAQLVTIREGSGIMKRDRFLGGATR
jgi:hypothetical protein